MKICMEKSQSARFSKAFSFFIRSIAGCVTSALWKRNTKCFPFRLLNVASKSSLGIYSPKHR